MHNRDRCLRLHLVQVCGVQLQLWTMGLNLEQGSVNFQELDLKYQGGIGRDDASCAAGTIAVVGRACQHGLLPQGHLGHSLIPALDHLIGWG